METQTQQKNKIELISIRHHIDESPDLSYLGEFSNKYEPFAIKHSNDPHYLTWFIPAQKRYARKDYERMMQFENGNVHCIGIQAEAEILIPQGNGVSKIQRISSAGLWGIESDSTDAYIKEIEAEELDQLKGLLEQLNTDMSNFDELAKNPQRAGR